MDEYRQLANGTYVSKARLIAADKHPLIFQNKSKQMFCRPLCVGVAEEGRTRHKPPPGRLGPVSCTGPD